MENRVVHFNQEGGFQSAALRNVSTFSPRILQYIPLPVIALSLGWNIVDLNPEAARLYHWERERVIGKNFIELSLRQKMPIPALPDLNSLVQEQTYIAPHLDVERDGESTLLAWRLNRCYEQQAGWDGFLLVGEFALHAQTPVASLQEPAAGSEAPSEKSLFVRPPVQSVDFSSVILHEVHALAELFLKKNVELEVVYEPHLPREVLGEPQNLGALIRNFLIQSYDALSAGSVILRVLCSETKQGWLSFEIYLEAAEPGWFSLNLILESGVQVSQAQENLSVPEQNAVITETELDFDAGSNQGDVEEKGTLHVLLVEDNKLAQKISKAMLEDLGCLVDVAGTGEDALARFDGQYDAIFMDIGLPDYDGLEVTRRIRGLEQERQGRAGVPIIAMTAHVSEMDKQQCFDSGMNDFISKPVSYETLQHAIERSVLRSRNYQVS